MEDREQFERERLKRARHVAVFFALLGILAIGSAVFAARQYYRAEAMKKEVGLQTYRAKEYYKAMKLLEEELKEKSDTFNAFDRHDGFIFIEEETEENVKFKIVLRSIDLMIHPQYEVFTENDTFNVAVDENGNGYFSRKKTGNYKSVDGDIVINDWNQNIKRIPFKYPEE